MDDKDSFNLLGERLAGRVLLILALVGMFATVGGFDHADRIAAEAKAKTDRAARIVAYRDWHEHDLKLSHPCGATIRDGGTSVSMGPERCVRVREEKR